MTREEFQTFIENAPVFSLDDYRDARETEHVSVTPKVAKQYRLQSADDLCNAPPLRWLVRGVLPVSGLAAVYGPSGSGKSFLTLDLCAAVADGAEWFGRRVCAAPVTYVCLEGEGGLSNRVKAWSVRNKRLLPANLHFVTEALDLRFRDDVEAIAQAVNNGNCASGLLVIDTLNRAAPGTDENSSKDMGELIEACKELQRLTGCLVLLVHHTGKDATKGLRGHSSLYAALDGAIEVTRDDSRRAWSVAKSKDDVDGESQPFKLAVVELGEDEDGEQVTSCVVETGDDGPSMTRPMPRGKTQSVVYSAMKAILSESKTFAQAGAPVGRPCVEIEAAIPVIADRLVCRPDQRLFQARRALTSMVGDREIYRASQGWIWAN
ncbi:helicase RepA family protein [Caballeronia sp. dw_276]|uniref:helicase RepA family protein n=1 Tax=Caballeronia sp. dw_276 TaxID=2719795 RepID=UPI001BD4BC59|nr:helicase RepA family protein [Caballeronia sp. dw_276]